MHLIRLFSFAGPLLLLAYSFSPSIATESLRGDLSYQKPRSMNTRAWVKQLELDRDKAEAGHQYDTFEALSKEISATLGGKYGFAKRKATPEERQIALSSIYRTRDYFAGKPDIIGDFYFSHNRQDCFEKMGTDSKFRTHMGVIAAADAIRYGTLNKEGFEEAFAEQHNEELRKEPTKKKKRTLEPPSFSKSVENIVANTHYDRDEACLRSSVNSLSAESWKSLIKECGALTDTTVPKMNLATFFRNFSISDDEGWHSHHIGNLARTTTLENGAMANPLGWWIDLFNCITPITKKAVLLDESQKTLFKDLEKKKFDGKTIGILYHFYSPEKEPVTFYLTRKMKSKWSQSLLGVTKTPEEIKKEDKEQSDLLKKRLDILRTVVQEDQPKEVEITPNIIQSDETVDALLLCSFKELTQLSDEDRLRLLKKAAFRGNRHALFWYVADYIKSSENTEEKSLYLKICKEVFGEEPEPGYGAGALSDLNAFLIKNKEGF